MTISGATPDQEKLWWSMCATRELASPDPKISVTGTETSCGKVELILTSSPYNLCGFSDRLDK